MAASLKRAADRVLLARIDTAAAAIERGCPGTDVPIVPALCLADPACGVDGCLRRHVDTSFSHQSPTPPATNSTVGKLGKFGDCAILEGWWKRYLRAESIVRSETKSRLHDNNLTTAPDVEGEAGPIRRFRTENWNLCLYCASATAQMESTVLNHSTTNNEADGSCLLCPT
jgi:hypothetical protein